MKKTKVLFAIWAIIVVVIIVLLTVMGLILKDRAEKYGELEAEMVDSVKNYAKDNSIFDDNLNEALIEGKILIESGYLDSLEVNKDICEGYVIVRNTNNSYLYEPFIKCDKYTTDGYLEEKDR